MVFFSGSDQKITGGGQMMLRVMLVDDEPFILQGLQVLIDWESEGFMIVKLAENGQEALEYLRENQVDLILADIKMPVMDGISLLKTVREEELSDALFVILSGYSEFTYAQTAVRYNCMDYILKPVQKENLLELLHKAAKKKAYSVKERLWKNQMKKNQLERQIVSVLRGKARKEDLEEIEQEFQLQGIIRYVHVGMDVVKLQDEFSDEELAEQKDVMLKNCQRFLEEASDCCFRDMIGYERDHEIAVLYIRNRMLPVGKCETDFFEKMQQEIQKNVRLPIYLLVGKAVEGAAKLGHSYSTACLLRSFIGFRELRKVYYYEEELQTERNAVILCKKSLDLLVEAIKDNDRMKMKSQLEVLYQELERPGMDGNMINMNINYLLFQLIHLAVEQDESVDQEEIMQHINEDVFEKRTDRGGKSHMRRFIYEYADYLSQLRKNVSGGVLHEIEREIRENYAENLTLKNLAQKYYINSSYLGQIFRKQYGQSFRDYLSAYRISQAEHLLIHTDKKISVIAEEVGYHDIDYFINRFIALKGVTPARYRRAAKTGG